MPDRHHGRAETLIWFSLEFAKSFGSKLNRTTALDLSLPTPHAFSMFPYTTPYQIQLQLMWDLFMAIERRKFALESPTGIASTRGMTRLTVSHGSNTGKITELAQWSPDMASG